MRAEVTGSDLRFEIRSLDDLGPVLDRLREKIGPPGIDDVSLMMAAHICPAPFLLDPLAMEAFRLEGLIAGGAPWPWPGGFYESPAIFAACREAIAQERMKIRSEMKDANGG